MQEALAFKEAADAKERGWCADYNWQSPYFAAMALLKQMDPADNRYVLPPTAVLSAQCRFLIQHE
jgi:hypothetical protein